MSILIKGMKMPKRGQRVYLRIDDRGAAVVVDSRYPDEAYRAIELPPHGDLIERKTAYDSLLYGMVMTGYQSQALDCIDEFSVPAIIEAEGTE